jgi:phosphoglucosamine mutase
MISASHNPFHDNGIKLFGADGFKIADEIEDEIARLVSNGDLDAIRPTAGEIGTARRIDDAVGRYIEFAKASFPKGMRLDGLRVVCDCAHGSAYKVGPNALRELGAEVIPLGDRPTGRNINEGCGSTQPEEMRATVIRERADVGIAFDGDADRIIMADEEGRLLDGNAVLTVLAIDMIERGDLPGKALATTILANSGLQQALEPYGARVAYTQVGDRYVVETMRAGEIPLGGEPSGHVVLLEHNLTGDALIAGLQVLAAMVRQDQPLSVLAAAYHPMPEARLSVPVAEDSLPDLAALTALQEEAESSLDGSGRVVLRPSGTEPVIRVMVQHPHVRTAERLAQELAAKLGAA